MKLSYPQGTTHMLYHDQYMGRWEYWKQTNLTWYCWDTYYKEWEEASPATWQMPKSIHILEGE